MYDYCIRQYNPMIPFGSIPSTKTIETLAKLRYQYFVARINNITKETDYLQTDGTWCSQAYPNGYFNTAQIALTLLTETL
jgi:hypothetical protein